MNKLDSLNELSHVKTCLRLAEDLAVDEQVHEVATREVLHHEIKEARVLEGVEEADNARVIVCNHGIALSASMGKLRACELYGNRHKKD